MAADGFRVYLTATLLIPISDGDHQFTAIMVEGQSLNYSHCNTALLYNETVILKGCWFLITNNIDLRIDRFIVGSDMFFVKRNLLRMYHDFEYISVPQIETWKKSFMFAYWHSFVIHSYNLHENEFQLMNDLEISIYISHWYMIEDKKK